MAAPFALSPGLADPGVLNFTTNAGKGIYKYATKSVYSNPEDRYDGSAANLPSFLHLMGNRAQEFGWGENGILDIDVNVGLPATINMITHYAEMSVNQVRAHAATHINGQNRAAQDSYMLHKCILNSIDMDTINNMKNKAAEYTINGNISGPSHLRVLIREAYSDTNATLTKIYRQISKLPWCITKINFNTSVFNKYVEELQAQLNARGATSTELLTNLFAAYQQVPDEVFQRYIERKENDYHDGTEITVRQLMNAALTKYQTRMDTGEWNVEDTKANQISALKAQLVQLRNQRSTKKKDKDEDKKKNSDNNGKKKKKYKPEPWMLIKPTPEELEQGSVKEVDGKTWYWCPKHNKWCRHKPEECKGIGWKPNTKKNKDKNETVQQVVIGTYKEEEDEEDDE